MQICTPPDAEAFSLDDVPNPDVVIGDAHRSDERARGAMFAALKGTLCAYLLEHAGRQRSSSTRSRWRS